ncbi:septation protein SpoVG family protein [Scatolibacter rhodanostii]|uniref:septation protein SpoVG family protein n=1 Tax=Scatolibacter rhodanostii TaxID=2014781 RepID=UPI000C08936F|nr:septation protein SpoVG family protein [Scatolibacter rhodanostii]
MNITDIRIRKKTNHGDLKAVVCLIIDGDYAMNDIHVIQNEERLYVQFPKWANGKSIFAPLNHQARQKIEDSILKVYRTV